MRVSARSANLYHPSTSHKPQHMYTHMHVGSTISFRNNVHTTIRVCPCPQSHAPASITQHTMTCSTCRLARQCSLCQPLPPIHIPHPTHICMSAEVSQQLSLPMETKVAPHGFMRCYCYACMMSVSGFDKLGGPVDSASSCAHYFASRCMLSAVLCNLLLSESQSDSISVSTLTHGV